MLLDPSCSGSGTAANRLDALLPSRRRRAAESDELDEVCAPKVLSVLIPLQTTFLAIQITGLGAE